MIVVDTSPDAPFNFTYTVGVSTHLNLAIRKFASLHPRKDALRYIWSIFWVSPTGQDRAGDRGDHSEIQTPYSTMTRPYGMTYIYMTYIHMTYIYMAYIYMAYITYKIPGRGVMIMAIIRPSMAGRLSGAPRSLRSACSLREKEREKEREERERERKREKERET